MGLEPRTPGLSPARGHRTRPASSARRDRAGGRADGLTGYQTGGCSTKASEQGGPIPPRRVPEQRRGRAEPPASGSRAGPGGEGCVPEACVCVADTPGVGVGGVRHLRRVRAPRMPGLRVCPGHPGCARRACPGSRGVLRSGRWGALSFGLGVLKAWELAALGAGAWGHWSGLGSRSPASAWLGLLQGRGRARCPAENEPSPRSRLRHKPPPAPRALNAPRPPPGQAGAPRAARPRSARDLEETPRPGPAVPARGQCWSTHVLRAPRAWPGAGKAVDSGSGQHLAPSELGLGVWTAPSTP